MTGWLEQEELFRTKLQEGHYWAERVAVDLESQGIDVQITPYSMREHVNERHKWRNEYDLLANGHRIEVKSRNHVFTRPEDYPYPTITVYSKNGWHRKTHRPCAVIVISQVTGASVVIPVSSQQHWLTKTVHDPHRDIDYELIECPSQYIKPLAELVDWLKTT